MKIDNTELAHERDASWIIALYHAIYGGDPGPEGSQIVIGPEQVRSAAAGAIASLAGYLVTEAQPVGLASTGASHPALAALGIEHVSYLSKGPQPEPWAVRPMTCVRVGTSGVVCWPGLPHHPLH